MMSDDELRAYCRRLSITEAGHELIVRILSAPPSRATSGRAGNVRGWFPSPKLGMTISYESHHHELVAAYLYEAATDVHEYRDQPGAIRLRYDLPCGRRANVLHTPDFLVLRANWAGWVEVKPRASLERLVAEKPYRFQRAGDGYACEPGALFAAEYHLGYEVLCTDDLSPSFARNFRYLEDYFRAPGPIDPALVDRVLGHARSQPGCTLKELAEATGAEPETLHILIAQCVLYIDLGNDLVMRPGACRVYADAPHMRTYAALVAARLPLDPRAPQLVPGAEVLFGDRRCVVLASTESVVTLHAPGLPLIDLPVPDAAKYLAEGRIRNTDASPGISESAAYWRYKNIPAKYLAHAASRYDAVVNERPVTRHGRPLKERALRDLRRSIAEAEASCGCGLVGAAPKHYLKGNRNPKIPTAVKDRALALLKETYPTDKAQDKTPVCSLVRARLRAEGVKRPPSKKTLRHMLKSLRQAEMVEAREGKRAAHAHQGYCWYLTRKTPPHGDRPLEIVHIDTQLLKLGLVSELTGEFIGRPRLTAAIDAYSRMLLAYYLSFDAPSAYAVISLLRLIVHQYGRLPQIIVHDNGPEFDNHAFLTALSLGPTTNKARPPDQPRKGTVVEALFGVTDHVFCARLTGNYRMRALKGPRGLSRDIQPKKHALWRLAPLYEQFADFAATYNTELRHPALHRTPKDVFDSGLIAGGLREHRIIQNLREFDVMVLPLAKGPPRLVKPGMGVKVDGLCYSSEALDVQELWATKVPVKVDPDDIGHVYVQDIRRGRWLECHASDRGKYTELTNRLAGVTVRERQIVAAEIRALTHGDIARRAEVEREDILLALNDRIASRERALQREKDEARKRGLASVTGAASVNGNGSHPSPTKPSPEEAGNGSVINEVLRDYRHKRMEDLR